VSKRDRDSVFMVIIKDSEQLHFRFSLLYIGIVILTTDLYYMNFH